MRRSAFLIVYSIANAGLVLYGLLLLWMPGLLLTSLYQPAAVFPEDTFWIFRLSSLIRLLGYFNLLLGAVGLFLLWRYHIGR
jgi:hypothetical protein